jgi:hypothetical protein
VRKVYVGENAVAYVRGEMYECRNSVVGDREVLTSLRVRPTDRRYY